MSKCQIISKEKENPVCMGLPEVFVFHCCVFYVLVTFFIYYRHKERSGGLLSRSAKKNSSVKGCIVFGFKPLGLEKKGKKER